MANLVVYKGDDTTGIFGRHLQFTITVQEGVSLVGCVAKFTVHKITKSWSNITPGQQVEIIYTHDETASMPVGGTYGIFQIVDASNNIRTFDDSVPFLVTNDIRQVYPGSSQATVYVGQMIKWTDIAGRPATVVQKVNNTLPDTNGNVDDEAGIRSICTMINTIKNLLKPQTALLALFAILSTTLSGAYVETNKLVNLLGKSNVVTAVSFEGLATTNELTTVKTNLEDKISKAAPADYTTTNAVKSIAADASVTNAGAVAVAAADATAKANAAREQAKAASLSLADGGVITNNVRITGMYALKFGNTSDDGGNVNFSTVEQCFNSESPNYGRLLLSSAELMIWQEPIAIMSDITDAITPATNDASIVRYKNGTLKHGTNTVVATEVGALPATNPNDSEMKVAWDSVSLNLSGGYFYASSAKFMYNDVFDGSGTTSLRDELDALAPKSMISATDATFVTATTNAVANSDNLWNQSNAKLTTRITQVVSNYVDRTNAHFSNEVLAVGLNVPSNTIAAINYMATNDTLVAVLGEFAENPPIDPTTGATTIGGLLAALAAAVAWLKRKTAEIETNVGTANSDLEDALGGNS